MLLNLSNTTESWIMHNYVELKLLHDTIDTWKKVYKIQLSYGWSRYYAKHHVTNLCNPWLHLWYLLNNFFLLFGKFRKEKSRYARFASWAWDMKPYSKYCTYFTARFTYRLSAYIIKFSHANCKGHCNGFQKKNIQIATIGFIQKLYLYSSYVF